jgi:hypothetical protein
MERIGKLLIAIGIAAASLGLLVLALSQLGLEPLPGDIVVRRGNFVFYSPLGFSLVLSVLMTITLNLLERR